MPRVFTIEKLQPNTDCANKASLHGKVIDIFEPGEDRPSVYDTDLLSTTIIDKLDRYDYVPDEDYIVLHGSKNLLSNLIAAVVYEFGQVNALMFDYGAQTYRPIKIGKPLVAAS